MGNRIVEFSQGSKYYYQRGNYYYYKNNLDRALSYYQRALAVDPANPANHFNVACLLSELGKFKESISIFHQVTKMDSALSESWFWLAMNYGQLQKYKEACHYLRKYLEEEPDGDYSWQAEEILEYIRADLPMLSPGQRLKIDRLCGNGIDLITQGRLEEAIKCFSRASAIEPEMTAPKNNLALSWFYLGEMGKAIELTWEILRSEPNNLFANCNLCTFYFIIDDQLSLRRQIPVLNGLWSEDPDEMLKLGTTYGLLGLHRQALDVFRYLQDTGIFSFELLLLLGVAFFNCGQFLRAAQVFDRVNTLEPDNPYELYRLLCTGPRQIKLPYHLQVPQAAIAGIMNPELEPANYNEIKNRPELWPHLLWLIRNGSTVTRKRILEAVVNIQHPSLMAQVITLVWNERVDIDCRGQIYAHLAENGFPVGAQRYWNHGRFSKNRAWVLEAALADISRKGYGFAAMNIAYTTWSVFCRKANRRIRNLQLWRGALILMVLGLDQLEDIAVEFDLAPDLLVQTVTQFSCIPL